jgi:POT family proton-dependent oligopeptide transporter
LVLLAIGSGVIKPNISTLMGDTYDQQRPGQTQLRSAAFLWFYFSVNLGALISQYLLPDIRTKYGYAIAFQFPAWLMVLALVIFASGKPLYAKERIGLTETDPEARREQWKVILKLFKIFGLMILFWVPYEHNDSIWVFFNRDYVNLHVPFSDKPVEPDKIQFLNPLCVIIFAPLFGTLFPIIDPKGRFITARSKITVGFVIGAISSGIMTMCGFAATSPNSIWIGWVALAYILLTIAEVLVYGTGLELAYAEAPAHMKGFITGCFLLTMTLANFINMPFAQLYGGSLKGDARPSYALSPGWFFLVAGLFTVAALVGMLFMTDKKPQEPATVVP